MKNAFTQWLQDNYEQNSLADMANHGCTGGVGGMIYYTETEAIYKQFSNELHEILDNFKDQVGEWPDYVVSDLGNYPAFCNSVVWFCAEFIAQELTQGIYEDEIA